MTVRIRTTMRPWEDLEVSETEAADLRRQGLLADDQPKQGEQSIDKPKGRPVPDNPQA